MLNRTLSANLNGLNLGTRTLANLQLAGFNTVVDTLRLRHEHPQMRKDSMRGGDSKHKGDTSISISIRGSLPSFASPVSPVPSPIPPYPGRPSEGRCEVVVACPRLERESELRSSRTSWGAWSQAQAQAQFWAMQATAMTRTETIPGAIFAAGG